MENNNKTEHFDHPPSPQELAEIYMQLGENDPTSPNYKRTLVRPKAPIWQLILFILIIAGSSVLSYFGVVFLFESKIIAILSAIIIPILVILLLAKYILIASVKTYQAFAPDHVRNRCRYEPSCSVYMIQAVKKYGFFKGFKKGIKRWKSCKPPNGGFDEP